MAYQDILKILDPAKTCSSAQKFVDIYLRLSGLPANGQLAESDCIRVRICEGRFALLIREVRGVIYISSSFLFFCYIMCMCVYICIGGGHAVLNEMILFFLKPIFTV